MPVVLPLHPRTKAKLARQNNSDALKGLTILDPVPYLEMQRLQMSAQMMLTASGGMQKKAYFHQVPCITLRDETEWVETVEAGWNQLVGANENAVIQAARNAKVPAIKESLLYGKGHSSQKVITTLVDLVMLSAN